MLKDLGLSWVILGHSERRHVVGESDEVGAGWREAGRWVPGAGRWVLGAARGWLAGSSVGKVERGALHPCLDSPFPHPLPH